ncbi:nucleoside kinase [Devosia sp.]|uniref:nucleoside kinase n=1 Tax=Devosia sp. TaxID=1871048 RepID=UPI002FC5EB9E
MAIRNYLIKGISGAGKTTVAEELERRGYHVIHGDRTLAYYGEPQTGAPLDGPPPDSGTNLIEWGYAHWIWPVDAVKSLLADQSHSHTFFCGDSKNFHHFIHLFDAVFVLEVDADTLNRRLIARPDDEFGGKPAERQFVLRYHAAKEDIPSGGIVIDATARVDHVVDEILQKCG